MPSNPTEHPIRPKPTPEASPSSPDSDGDAFLADYDRHLDTLHEADSRPLTQEQLKEAEAALREAFEQFDPKPQFPDVNFFGVAYQLDRICCPAYPPENTGSLEKKTIDAIEPILGKLSEEFPLAVQRFRWMFTRQEPTEHSDHAFDPSGWIRNGNEIFEHYQGVVDTNPEEAADFALQAIGSNGADGIGLRIMQEIIGTKGWDFVIGCALHPTVAFIGTKRRFHELKECLHKLSTPANLNSAKIEQLLEETENDLEWIDLKSYLTNRRSAENLDATNPSFCRNLLRDHDIPFYDIGKTRDVAEEILMNEWEAYYGLLEELHWQLREMYTNYEGEPDTPFITDRMERWESMTPRELLDDIYPVFSFNLVIRYVPDDIGVIDPQARADSEKGRLIRSLTLDDATLREEAGKLVAQNDAAYFQTLFEIEYHVKGKLSAVRQCGKADFVSPLRRNAKRERKTGPDEWGYVINSSALPLAHDTVALYSPTGRLLGVYETDDSAETRFDSMELAGFMNMKHALSDSVNFSPNENAAAVMLLFWNKLPEQWRRSLRDLYSTFDVDIDAFVEACPDSFELAASFSQDIAPLLSRYPAFATDLGKFVDRKIRSFLGKVEAPEEMDVNQFLILMNSEFGVTDTDEGDVRDLFENLNLEATASLRKNLGIDFRDISRREFFSLVRYLQSTNHGEGYETIRKFLAQTEDPQKKGDRIKAFLSVERGGTEMGKKIIEIGGWIPELADEIFRKYAEIVRSADDVDTALDTAFASEHHTGHTSAICATLIGKANALLVESHKMIRTLMLEREIHDGNAILMRSIDSDVDGYATEDYARIEKQEIEKLKKNLDAIRGDIELWKGGFRTLYEEGVVTDFSEVAGVEFGAKSAEELTEEEKDAMRTMYDENYSESAGYSDEFRETLFRGLEEAFTKKDGTRFYVLKKGGALIDYNRFEDLPETEGDTRPRKYVGSFNVAPEYRGSKLGDKMFDDCLAQETRDGSIITAYADPTLPISAHYLETNGFVATGIENIGGRPLLRIISDPDMNAKLSTKRPSFNDEVATGVADQGSPREYVSVRKTGLGDMPAIASSMLEKGWLLTRLQKDTGNDDRSAVIAVFEKPR